MNPNEIYPKNVSYKTRLFLSGKLLGGVCLLNSTEKVIWLLKRLGEPPYELSLTQLSREIGYPKSGIYKILLTLQKDGLILQNRDSKKYTVGPTLFRLGSLYNESKGIASVADPVMQRLAQQTQETVSLAIREQDEAVMIHKIESPHAIRLFGKLGQRYPLNAGAIGKLLAAYHDPTRIEKLLSTLKLQKHTEKTRTDPLELKQEYAKIRQTGYAISDEEKIPGAFGIAAPVRNADGLVSSTLCIAGPKDRFTQEKQLEWIPLLIAAANELTFLLSGKNRTVSPAGN